MESLWSGASLVNPDAFTRTTAWFDVMDQASGAEYQAVRYRLDDWWHTTAEPFRSDVAGRIRSRSDPAAHGAVTELFLANELHRVGFQVEPGSLGNTTPDFLCRTREGGEVLVEVTSINPPKVDHKQAQRVNELLDALDDPHTDRSGLPATMLHVTTWSVGTESAPARTVAQGVRDWLTKQGDIDGTTGWAERVPFSAEPTLWWAKAPSGRAVGEFTTSVGDYGDNHRHAKDLQQRGYTWVLSFTRIPSPPATASADDASSNGRVGIHAWGLGGVLPDTRVPGAIAGKVEKYGKPARAANIPLVVAIGDPEWLSPAHHDLSALESLFSGSLTETMVPGPSGWVSLGVSRNDDGLWTRPRMHRLDGVIILNTQRWRWAELSVTAFAVNPGSPHPSALQPMQAAWPAPIPNQR